MPESVLMAVYSFPLFTQGEDDVLIGMVIYTVICVAFILLVFIQPEIITKDRLFYLVLAQAVSEFVGVVFDNKICLLFALLLVVLFFPSLFVCLTREYVMTGSESPSSTSSSTKLNHHIQLIAVHLYLQSVFMLFVTVVVICSCRRFLFVS